MAPYRLQSLAVSKLSKLNFPRVNAPVAARRVSTGAVDAAGGTTDSSPAPTSAAATDGAVAGAGEFVGAGAANIGMKFMSMLTRIAQHAHLSGGTT